MSKGEHVVLFTEETLGNLNLKNRFVVAPMTRISADPDGTPNAEMGEYYEKYALGGFGLVITEGTYIDEEHSQGYIDQPGIANGKQVEGWKPIVQQVRSHGVPILQQLLHSGALVQHNRFVDHSVAPSAIQPKGEMAARYKGEGKFPLPRELQKTEIDRIVSNYGDAAARSIEAGFDGIEIHGANGYLPDEFLTSYTNSRTDEYGGEVENRIRFHCEVIKNIRSKIGEKVLGVRISQTKINDFEHEWEGKEKDAKIIFTSLKDAGVDYIHISTHKGLVDIWDSGKNLAGFAKDYTGITVIGCGGLHIKENATKILESRNADFIAIGKGSLADQSLPNKLAKGENPVEFDPGMISPVATLENTARWKIENSAS